MVMLGRSPVTLSSIATLLTACATERIVNPPPPPPPPPGSLSVVVNVTGNGTDADGFSLTVGTLPAVHIVPNGAATVDGLPPGMHTLRLDDVAPQCYTAYTNTQSVIIASQQTSSVQLLATCFGGIAYNGTDGGNGYKIFYLGEDGRTTQLTFGPGTESLRDWTRDGTRVIFESRPNGFSTAGDLYSIKIDGTDLQRLTTDPWDDQLPSVSPDGKSIVFQRVNTPTSVQASLYIVNTDGTGEHALLDLGHMDFDATWAGGDTIVFSCDRFGASWDLCAVASDGTGLRKVLSSVGGQNADASPDGTRLAFESFAGGQAFWVAPLPSGTPVRLTPDEVSYSAAWSPDGSQLVIGTAIGVPNNPEYRLERVNWDGTGLTPLTEFFDAAGDGTWSADGKRIVYFARRASSQQLWVMKHDGTDAHPITAGPYPKFHPLWNPKAQPGL
ncbi:MAG: hypothetical protein DMD64_04270 [Gemmatimonadetes bacterium]|nr:MAG: hypothetical protein DMD64_04270 [Gemmatimonadota bacterium]